MRFRIICTGYNCDQYTGKAVESVLNQTHKDWKLYLVNDGSTDNTATILNRYKWNNNILVFNHEKNKGAAYQRYYTINYYANADTDVIVLMGMDDELLPDCLETIAKEYESGKWMTYGNWVNQYGDGLPSDFKLDFDKKTHENRDYRKVQYRSTAPNTFYAFLFKQIPPEDFMINGKWLDTTTESETMFSCLEMCGKDRIGVIKKQIYLYNQNLPNGTQRRLGQAYKNDIYAQIIKREKKNLYVRSL